MIHAVLLSGILMSSSIATNEVVADVISSSKMAADALEGAKLGAAAGLKDGRYTPEEYRCFVQLPEGRVYNAISTVLVHRLSVSQLESAKRFYQSEAGQIYVQVSHRKFLLLAGAPAPEVRANVTESHLEAVRKFKSSEVGQQLTELSSPTMQEVSHQVSQVLNAHFQQCKR